MTSHHYWLPPVTAVLLSLSAATEGFAQNSEPAARAKDLPKVAPNSPDEPRAENLSLAKSAEFLDGVALSWTRERKCGTCHTNYPYLMSRPFLKGPTAASDEVRRFFEDRVANWDRDQKEARPRWDAEVVATAVALALNDDRTTGKLHPLTRRALDRMWTVQQPGGGWNWLKCNWPPFEHDDYFGAVLGALGAGVAPDGYAQTAPARQGLAKLRKYFQANRPPDLHHKTWLLWASLEVDGLMTPAERDGTVKELLALERPGGGWSLPSLGDWKRRDGTLNDKNAPSDGYGTGFVIYVLRKAGVPGTDERIRRGLTWLKANQRASGRWFTRSLNNDRAHYIANAGTGFAVMALQSCADGDK
jgi:squalene-hopene/tetraprenyl-beta-curcumene cyclase